MITLITRWWWIVISLVLLGGLLFFIQYTHTANMVQAAADSGRQIAAITSDNTALQNLIAKNIETTLPSSAGGITFFNPANDIVVARSQGNQEVQVSVTYHMPVLGVVQHVFGLGTTIPITRTVTEAMDYAHNGLHATLTQTPPQRIAINNVSVDTSSGNVDMMIAGYGFGNAPQGVPGTTMGSFLQFADLTQGWTAGTQTSGLAITYSSWNNNQIVISGIQAYGKGTEVIQPGDNAQITITSSNGTATYDFVVKTSGTEQYKVSLSTSASNVATDTAVTLSATSSVPGTGTDGIGIYDATTNTYLAWSASGNAVTQLVNNGTPSSQTYIAYFGPKGQISNALATSADEGVIWTGGTNSSIYAVMVQSGSVYLLDVYGNNLQGASVSGTGLSSPSQLSPNQMQVQAASISDISGVVNLANGQHVPFTAQVY